MGHPRRKIDHGRMYLVTNRLAEGLPLVPNEFINQLLLGALARAAGLHTGIVICTFCWMQNHYHLLVVTYGDPSELSDFLHDLNDEVAKMVVRITGKRNVKIWAQRPHVALIGDYLAAVREFSYCSLNPVAAYLCAKASDWIGANGYRFLFDQKPLLCKWTPTSRLRPLPHTPFKKKQIKQLCAALEKKPRKQYELKVQPFAWKHCFPETKEMTDGDVRELILAEVAAGEAEYANNRRKEKKRVAEPDNLRYQNPYKKFKPKKYGRRVYCICNDPALREQLIAEYKVFCEECMVIWLRWQQGDYFPTYPPGAFLPPHKPMANAICWGS